MFGDALYGEYTALYVIIAVALAWYGAYLNDKRQDAARARGESYADGSSEESNHPLWPTLKWILIIVGIVSTCALHPCLGLPIIVFAPIIARQVFPPTK